MVSRPVVMGGARNPLGQVIPRLRLNGELGKQKIEESIHYVDLDIVCHCAYYVFINIAIGVICVAQLAAQFTPQLTPQLTTEQVTQILGVIRSQAALEGHRLSIAVVDGGGHLIGFLRMDGALLASVEVSQVKARTAVLFGTATKNLPSHAPIAGPMADAVSFPIALLPGGVPIQVNGQLLGGIGVGGGTGEQDDAAAHIGLSVFNC